MNGVYSAQHSQMSYYASLASSFSYIIPYDRTQDCNIFGPICQTGSITVDVNLTTAVATAATVLPCSSYLTLQSYYLEAPIAGDLDVVGVDLWALPDHWGVSFGRSPQCTSLAQAYSSGQISISNCGDRNTVIHSSLISIIEGGSIDLKPADMQSLMQPPGVLRAFDMNYWGTCCGNCTLDIAEVRLYYFPDESINNCSLNQTSNHTTRQESKEQGNASASIAVLSGLTL